MDDSASVREGLAISLEAFPDLDLVAEAANGAEAIRLCEQVQPDIVLMDLAMPGIDGVATTRAIRKALPDTHVIVLTGVREKSMIQSALQAGAIGYLLKNVSVSALVNTIQSVYNTGSSGLMRQGLESPL
ncbi:response regulator [Aggregatilinea lenta]|uniref:response regulator n=1 Tax=Aggregatilinea lenta TaxID=913108 RepID=UPI0013C34305|nr:response regulator transcription factor [Aggregatilinea lenta]